MLLYRNMRDGIPQRIYLKKNQALIKEIVVVTADSVHFMLKTIIRFILIIFDNSLTIINWN